MTDADYPAAHSMDTHWFAVDKDGHVGYFSTGELGAVPLGALQHHWVDTLHPLCELLPRGEAIYDFEGHHSLGGWHGESHSQPGGEVADRLLLFLTSPLWLADSLARGEATALPSTRGVAVLVVELIRSVFDQIHADGACLGCYDLFLMPYRLDVDDPSMASASGLYTYSHREYSEVVEPYRRVLLPRDPIHIDQIPPDVRRSIAQVRFETLRFADALFIQPCELMSVEAQEAGYLTSDGRRVCRLPGASLSAYRRFYTRFMSKEHEWLQAFTVEPPDPIHPSSAARRRKKGDARGS